MHLNKNLFYVHRCVTGFYILMLIIAIFLLANYGVKKENLIFSVFVLAIYAGLGALHFRASNEVSKGTESGKNLSQGVGVLLLLGFPIGTILGIIILVLTAKKRWQWGELPEYENIE